MMGPGGGLLGRVLAGLFGAALGGIVTLSLALTATAWHVGFWSPVVVGAVVGAAFGDRGLQRLARIVGWMG